MGLNFGAGLQALANFGTGYMQENRNQQQDQSNQVALQSAQLDLQQRQLQAQQQQQMSDDAIKQSIQQQQQAPKPGQQSQQGQQPPQVDQVGQLQQLAQTEMSKGNLVGAGQLQSQAANLGNAQMAEQQKKATLQAANLTASIKGMQYASQLFAGVTDQQAYSAAKAQGMSNSDILPEGRNHIANLPDKYDPNIVSQLVHSGMSAVQQQTAQLNQLKFSSEQQSRSFRDGLAAQHEKLYAAKTVADIAHQTTQKKAGAAAQVPTATMLKELAPIAADVLGVTQSDPNLMGPNSTAPAPGSNAAPKIDYNTPALIGIASHVKQLMTNGMPFDTAARQATEQAVKDGQLQQSDLKDGKKSYTYHTSGSGASEDNPIPLHGLTKGHLVKGKWYKSVDGRVQQYQ